MVRHIDSSRQVIKTDGQKRKLQDWHCGFTVALKVPPALPEAESDGHTILATKNDAYPRLVFHQVGSKRRGSERLTEITSGRLEISVNLGHPPCCAFGQSRTGFVVPDLSDVTSAHAQLEQEGATRKLLRSVALDAREHGDFKCSSGCSAIVSSHWLPSSPNL